MHGNGRSTSRPQGAAGLAALLQGELLPHKPCHLLARHLEIGAATYAGESACWRRRWRQGACTAGVGLRWILCCSIREQPACLLQHEIQEGGGGGRSSRSGGSETADLVNYGMQRQEVVAPAAFVAGRGTLQHRVVWREGISKGPLRVV